LVKLEIITGTLATHKFGTNWVVVQWYTQEAIF